MDGIYSARVSPKGNYLVTGNRGYNVFAYMTEKRLRNCSASYCRSVQTTTSKTLVIACDGEVSISGFTTVRSWHDRKE